MVRTVVQVLVWWVIAFVLTHIEDIKDLTNAAVDLFLF